ncbi:MAG: GSCFA domain-containing protein [Prevotella sp.]|nr:GSCFA domain-containing protein [Prevotella sp.]
MNLQTTVTIQKANFEIKPTDNFLFVGSCFADKIGGIFKDNHFKATVNPYGVMYNPASVLHTITKEKEAGACYDIAVITLGTNHIYILNETGEIVDNCQKRPASLFTEKELSVEECADYLRQCIEMLREINPDIHIIFTVSPIRYAKYGYHESQLSKATLLMAIAGLRSKFQGLRSTQNYQLSIVNYQLSTSYFPSYEIMMDELRDYRFYADDMLHPSDLAVQYIYERFRETYFSINAKAMEVEWQPIKKALSHRPFNAESEEYKAFIAKAKADEKAFCKRWKL